jgi:hypothetical protein
MQDSSSEDFLASAQDPSLRLKNGCGQDYAQGEVLKRKLHTTDFSSPFVWPRGFDLYCDLT